MVIPVDNEQHHGSDKDRGKKARITGATGGETGQGYCIWRIAELMEIKNSAGNSTSCKFKDCQLAHVKTLKDISKTKLNELIEEKLNEDTPMRKKMEEWVDKYTEA